MTERRLTIIFDVDGTLVDSTYHHAIAWHRAFRTCGLDVPVWRIHRAVGMGGDRLVAEVAGDVVEDKIGDVLRERWQEAYQQLHSEIEPLPAARRLIEALHGKGHQVCVASSGSREDTDFALDVVGVHGLLVTVVSGDDAESSKPAPDVLEVALERAGGGPAVLVGDTVYDVEAAARLGIVCVAVRTGGFGVDELESAGAAVVLEDLEAATELDWGSLG